MKKILSCLLAIIIISICVVPCFAESPALSLRASKLLVNPGDVVTVTVGISGNSGLGTLNFSINYNPAEFEYVSGSAQATALFGDPVVNDRNAGSVLYVTATGAENGLQDSGDLISIQLKALKSGGVVSLSVKDATDANDNSVTVTKASVSISCAHGKMEWKVTKAATCTAKGTETGTCACGHTATRDIAEIAHTYKDSVVVKEATCTTSGIRRGTCTVCKASGAESVIPAKGHNYTEWVVTKEPTMITMGVKERVCRTCNDKQTQMVAALNQELPSDVPTSDELSTDPITDWDPITTTRPNVDSYFEIETETTEPSGGLFGNSNFTESDMAALIVIILAVLLVVILVVYIILLRQRKK